MAQDDAIAEIKRRADIAHVIGRYVQLKKQGRSYVGLCPFHQEKTPSFYVHPDDGYFKCFGCDAKGDVFSFLERQTGQAFIDILRTLAQETDVALEERSENPEQRRRRQERKRLLRVLALAQTYYRARLVADDGQLARAYLDGARRITPGSIESFGLGFGGNREDGLLEYLRAEGVTDDDAITAGVIGRGQRGPYDFFRQRVMFPIRDVRGDIVTFAGRAFGEAKDRRPKYVNGPSSPLYDKGRVLYGLFESLPTLKRGRPGVLVEGQLDVVASHHVGVTTAFAPCGTSLTEGHLEELRRYTDRLVICLDADAAGRAAAERAVLLALKAGFDVSWAQLIEKDPDEMVRAGEGEALRHAIEAAPAAIDRLLDAAVHEGAGSARDRVRAIDRLLPFLAAPPRELTRSQFIRAAAAALHEDERILAAEVEQRGRGEISRQLRREGRREEGAAPPPASVGPSSSQLDDELTPAPTGVGLVRRTAPPAKWSEAERLLATALLVHPLLVPRCGVLLEGLRNPELRDFIERLNDALVRFHDLEPHKVLLEHVHARRGSALFELLVEVHRRKGFEEPHRVFSESAAAETIDDYLLRFDARPFRERLRDVHRAMAEAERAEAHDDWRRLQGLQRVLVDALRPLERGEEAQRALPESRPLMALSPPTPAILDDAEPAAAPVIPLHRTAPSSSTATTTPIIEPNSDDEDWDDPWDDPL